jgi:hypothetical protein
MGEDNIVRPFALDGVEHLKATGEPNVQQAINPAIYSLVGRAHIYRIPTHQELTSIGAFYYCGEAWSELALSLTNLS